MVSVERVTLTLPNDLVRDIDRRENNRSKFVAEAVRHELDRRRRAELRRSLQNPHPESAALAETACETAYVCYFILSALGIPPPFPHP